HNDAVTDSPWTLLYSRAIDSREVLEVTHRRQRGRIVSVIRGLRPPREELYELVQAALAETSAGHLRPLIGQIFPLKHAAGTHAPMEQHTTVCKTLLQTANPGSDILERRMVCGPSTVPQTTDPVALDARGPRNKCRQPSQRPSRMTVGLASSAAFDHHA